MHLNWEFKCYDVFYVHDEVVKRLRRFLFVPNEPWLNFVFDHPMLSFQSYGLVGIKTLSLRITFQSGVVIGPFAIASRCHSHFCMWTSVALTVLWASVMPKSIQSMVECGPTVPFGVTAWCLMGKCQAISYRVLKLNVSVSITIQ